MCPPQAKKESKHTEKAATTTKRQGKTAGDLFKV